jgi:hypothetical protein
MSAPERAPRKENACAACGKGLPAGTGRFLVGRHEICVQCHDLGRRGPPSEPADDSPTAGA